KGFHFEISGYSSVPCTYEGLFGVANSPQDTDLIANCPLAVEPEGSPFFFGLKRRRSCVSNERPLGSRWPAGSMHRMPARPGQPGDALSFSLAFKPFTPVQTLQ